jgi:cytochrome c oxidase assembly factor CtaG
MAFFEYSPPLGVIVGLIGLQALYALCVGPFRNRFRGAEPVSVGRQLVFSQGVVTLLLALASPLHALSDRYLFSAHMVQHLLIVYVAAPLLLAGTPGWLLAEVLRVTHLTRVARWSTSGLVAFVLFNLVFAFAHLPPLYELTLAFPPLHALEHVVFLVTGLVLWMPILSPLPSALPRFPYLGQMLYLFAQTLPANLVGAILVMSSVALYPTYALAPRVVDGLTPVHDQQLGGLIMWAGGTFYFLIAGAVVFFIWAGQEEAASRRPSGTARASGGDVYPQYR